MPKKPDKKSFAKRNRLIGSLVASVLSKKLRTIHKFYKAEPTRKVPGRKGMTYKEEDWVDEVAIAYRGMDE